MFNKQETYYTVLFYVIRGVRLGQPTRQPVDDRTAAAKTTAIQSRHRLYWCEKEKKEASKEK